MNRKAIIISLSGKILSSKEKKLLVSQKPWGIILFKRNIDTFKQTKKLISLIKIIMKDKKYPILIDEEGGSISRLKKIIDNKLFSQKFFGDLFFKNKKTSIALYKYYIESICYIFKTLGININTVPVLDILKKHTHKIIGNRSYSKDINVIRSLGTICVESYKMNKIATVIKHIPGHGDALSDSHKKLPVVKTSYSKLNNVDFRCFKEVNSFFAMTAHILYSKIDIKNVSTHSKIIINNIIRKKIGFKGILISDDISMKALKYNLITNAKKSLDAGCNLVLYGGGKYKESYKLLKHMPLIDRFTKKKTAEFYKFLR